MRIIENDILATVDISANSSATAAIIKRFAKSGRVVIPNSEGVIRSVIICDGAKGVEIIFSIFSTVYVVNQIKESGYIII